MDYFLRRRLLLLAGIAVSYAGVYKGALASANGGAFVAVREKLVELEVACAGRLGVSVIDLGNGARFQYRADERFPMTSTFKVMAVSAILKQSMQEGGFLQQQVVYTQEDLVAWSPVTQRYVAGGMSVFELCAASLQYSDNTAVNLLMRLLGGPQAVTMFARSIGDEVFSLERWETALNSAIPGDLRDTSTPAAMEMSLRKLVLGDVLGVPEREQLWSWLKGNTTGDESIRAGVPPGWVVGDKTGGGSYGTTNDIAVIWPPTGGPIVMAVYFTQHKEDAIARRDVLAAVTRILLSELG